jgi:hypothetical protein
MMGLLSVGTMALLLGSLSMGQPPPKPCPADNAASIETRARNKPRQSRQNVAKTPQQTENPCEHNGTQSKSDASAEAVGWDPVTVWDGPNSGEVVGFFVLGLFVSAPIFVLVRRLRSRNNESEAAKKVLE